MLGFKVGVYTGQGGGVLRLHHFFVHKKFSSMASSVGLGLYGVGSAVCIFTPVLWFQQQRGLLNTMREFLHLKYQIKARIVETKVHIYITVGLFTLNGTTYREHQVESIYAINICRGFVMTSAPRISHYYY